MHASNHARGPAPHAHPPRAAEAQGLGSTIKQSLVDNTASYSMADAQASSRAGRLLGVTA